eukprot:6204959-Pleurochrysis_carterae.AAC.5
MEGSSRLTLASIDSDEMEPRRPFGRRVGAAGGALEAAPSAALMSRSEHDCTYRHSTHEP